MAWGLAMVAIAFLGLRFATISMGQSGLEPMAYFTPTPATTAAQVTTESVFDAGVEYWDQDIARWSVEYGVDEVDVKTLMQIESCGNPRAVSSSGAMGLFQVMPFHFYPGDNMIDPDTNAKKGLEFFHNLRENSGDLGQAYIGYNGGPSQMGRSYDQLPSQTQRYLWWSGMRVQAANGEEMSILGEWYKAGGYSLCQKAHEVLGIK